MVVELVSASGATLRAVGPVPKMSITPARPGGLPGRLGEHTDEVLRDWLDCEPERIADCAAEVRSRERAGRGPWQNPPSLSPEVAKCPDRNGCPVRVSTLSRSPKGVGVADLIDGAFLALQRGPAEQGRALVRRAHAGSRDVVGLTLTGR
jgi:hypothetical protein